MVGFKTIFIVCYYIIFENKTRMTKEKILKFAKKSIYDSQKGEKKN